jgi:hypothetical protein
LENAIKEALNNIQNDINSYQQSLQPNQPRRAERTLRPRGTSERVVTGLDERKQAYPIPKHTLRRMEELTVDGHVSRAVRTGQPSVLVDTSDHERQR